MGAEFSSSSAGLGDDGAISEPLGGDAADEGVGQEGRAEAFAGGTAVILPSIPIMKC